MKRSLLIAFVGLLAASTAFAAAGSVGLFANVGATSCAIQNAGPGQVGNDNVYVVHTGSDGTTGCGFSAVIPTCAGYFFIVDVPQPGVTSLGSSQTAISAGYGSCKTGVIPVIQMFVSQIAPANGCCAWTVQPPAGFTDPDGNPWTTPTSTDCSALIQEENAGAGTGIVSVNTATCPCNVDTHESTWGGVKELFRKGI